MEFAVQGRKPQLEPGPLASTAAKSRNGNGSSTVPYTREGFQNYGVFTCDPVHSRARFHALPTPTDAEVARVSKQRAYCAFCTGRGSFQIPTRPPTPASPTTILP